MSSRSARRTVVNDNMTQCGDSFRARYGKRPSWWAVFECKCGERYIIRTACANRSKGCFRCSNKSKTKHGKSATKIYFVWSEIKKRCTKKQSTNFKYYGGRGITICQKWMSFDGFLEDMGEPLPGMTIERVDNNSGYSKSNCKWATRSEQRRNTRQSLVWISHEGKTMCRSDWAAELGIPVNTLRRRMLTMSFEEAISVAVKTFEGEPNASA